LILLLPQCTEKKETSEEEAMSCDYLGETLINSLGWTLSSPYKLANYVYSYLPNQQTAAPLPVPDGAMLVSESSRVFVRMAGLSGALAVGLGAYGAHSFAHSEKSQELKAVFDTANKYHYLHTLALLATPLCRRPKLTGSLLVTGTLVFSGTCYYYALTQENWVRKFTPYGGSLLILAWLSMVL